MSTRRASELILAAEFSGLGFFSAVGVLRRPSLALNAAIGELRLDHADAQSRPVLIHALATKIAGKCSLDRPEVERALIDCLAARLAVEWKITIPAIGALHSLFVITRFEKADEGGLFDLVLHLASPPSFEALQNEDEGTG